MGSLNVAPGKVVPIPFPPIIEAKLVDGDGQEVRKGEPGALMVHCDAAGRYYERDHEKSNQTFVGDDWIRTGDMFIQDEQGSFRFAGRIGDQVKISGVWVSLLEIENCLHSHPAVKECVVLGIDDKDGLAKCKAFVCLNEGSAASEPMAGELIDFCKKKLGSYKAPKIVEFMKELPKTGQGKIDKRLLKEKGL